MVPKEMIEGVKYIIKCRARGRSYEWIKQSLMDNGWSAYLVRRMMDHPEVKRNDPDRETKPRVPKQPKKQPAKTVAKKPPQTDAGVEGARNVIDSTMMYARMAHDAEGIADNWDKQKEIVGVMQNLQAADAALQKNNDAQGRPITPELVGQGLQNMLNDMDRYGIWLRLHTNAPERTRKSLHALKGQLEVAVQACLHARG